MSLKVLSPIRTPHDKCYRCGQDRHKLGSMGDRCPAFQERLFECPWGSGFVHINHRRYGFLSGGPLLLRHNLTVVGKQHHVVRVSGTPPGAWITCRLQRTLALGASVLGWHKVGDIEPECAHLITNLTWIGKGGAQILREIREVAEYNEPESKEEDMYLRYAGVADV